MIFAQSVEGESEGVKLFPAVERGAVCGDFPVDSAVLLVVKMAQQPRFGPCGAFEIFGTFQRAVGRRESPKDAAVKYRAPRSFGIESAFARDTAVKSTPAVLHAADPERKYYLL